MSYVNIVIAQKQFQYNLFFLIKLNLFKLNSNKKKKNKRVNEQKKCHKHYPASIREWSNSIYVYNKNALNIIPQATVSSMKLIKSYFNFHNFKVEGKIINVRLLPRLKRLSSHRIFLSNLELKHTSNKVVLGLYIFNRQIVNYYQKISKSCVTTRSVPNIENLFKLIKQKGILSLKKANKEKLSAINTNIAPKVSIAPISPIAPRDVLTFTDLSHYVVNFYKKLLEKSLTKVKLFIYYNQLLFINKSKFNSTYLQHLKKYLEKIFNKNVEFNLVNIRRFYLNSDIFSEAFTLKIRKNRSKLLNSLNLIKRKVKLHDKKKLYYQPGLSESCLKQIMYVNDADLKKIVFNNIKYKHITGFRLEAKGRLTRRYTASRSIYKLIYKGNLLNIDSSYRGLSSVLLKGNLNSNLQYTKSKSKTRIGSFSLKNWISGN